MSELISISNLATWFYQNGRVIKAVDGISWDINPGEIVGLVGESGSGKSVSALSILGLIPNPPGKIVNGSISYNGKDLLKLGKQQMAEIRGNEIAMIFQEPMSALNPVMTVGKQIAEVLVKHKQMPWKQAGQKTIDLLEEVRIADPKDTFLKYPHQLSGGMCQRVVIAMALACNPKLIIADEPTTALDVTISAQILELMKNLGKKHLTAQLIITHNLGIVARYAHRVYVMYAGRIVEKADADKLYRHPGHPYTLGLLSSVPRIDSDCYQKLKPIKGVPPDLSDLPCGCAFHPRCEFKSSKCEQQAPMLENVDQTHAVACWNRINHAKA